MIVDQDRLRAKFITTNYFDLNADLTKLNSKEKYRGFIACTLGKVRLIDNF